MSETSAADRREDLSDWWTVRRDIRVLRRDVKRAEMHAKVSPD